MPNIVWIWNRNRNQNFSKVGTGTATSHYGSKTLLPGNTKNTKTPTHIFSTFKMTQRQSCNKTKYMLLHSVKNTNFLSVYANNKSFPTDLGIIIQYVDWNQFSQVRRTPEAAASRSRHCKRKFPQFKDDIWNQR